MPQLNDFSWVILSSIFVAIYEIFYLISQYSLFSTLCGKKMSHNFYFWLF